MNNLETKQYFGIGFMLFALLVIWMVIISPKGTDLNGLAIMTGIAIWSAVTAVILIFVEMD